MESNKNTAMKGTITWYSIAKDGLPKNDGTNPVKDLLAYKDNRAIVSKAIYFPTSNTWIHCAEWEPTHYAYCNYPK